MAEWDVLLSAAIEAVRGKVFYERLLLVPAYGFIIVFDLFLNNYGL